MGGIQRRRRRMRQHQPVNSPAPAPEEPLSAPPPAEDPAPPPASSTDAPPDATDGTASFSASPSSMPGAAPSSSRRNAQATDAADPDELDAGDATASKPVPRPPSPHHLAELSGTFAMTANVHDPEPAVAGAGNGSGNVPGAGASAEPHEDEHHDDHHHHHDTHHHHHHHDEVVSERGLRGLVGGGASQVSVSAAMRARDAARPSDEDIAAAERDLQIIRRGWVPREELTRPGRRSPTS